MNKYFKSKRTDRVYEYIGTYYVNLNNKQREMYRLKQVRPVPPELVVLELPPSWVEPFNYFEGKH